MGGGVGAWGGVIEITSKASNQNGLGTESERKVCLLPRRKIPWREGGSNLK